MKRITEPDALQLEFASRFPELVLASSSPNRKALLEIAGVNVSIFVPGIEEEMKGNTNEERILNIAGMKIRSYETSSAFRPEIPAIAADTLVLSDGMLIGKPADMDDAFRILRSLSGKEHEVITAAGLYLPGLGTSVFLDRSTVAFRSLSDDEIRKYIMTGEWNGAAGGYRLQMSGYKLIDRIHGDWTNVVGLPMRAILSRAFS